MEQLSMQFPEAPKMPPNPMEQHLDEMKKVQDEYGTTKPLVLGEDKEWYIPGYDGKMITIQEWKKLDDALYSNEKGDRKDIN